MSPPRTSRRRAPLVLCYHRVAAAHNTGGILEYQRRRGMVVDEHVFAAQMARLRSRLHVLSLADLLDGIDRDANLQGTCLVTFDDGYADFQIRALPVLTELDLPCVLFPVMRCAMNASVSMPNDRLYRILCSPESSRALSPVERADHALGDWKRAFLRSTPQAQEDALAALARRVGLDAEPPVPKDDRLLAEAELASLPSSVALGAHGVQHHLLTTLPADDLDDALRTPRAWLATLRCAPGDGETVAWPSGAHGAREIAAAVRAGYRAGFAVQPGAWFQRTGSIPRSVAPNEPEAIDTLIDLHEEAR